MKKKVYDALHNKVIVILNNITYHKQTQIYMNYERLLEIPSEPSSSDTISDNQELSSGKINQSLFSIEDLSDKFPRSSDESERLNFANITTNSSKL